MLAILGVSLTNETSTYKANLISDISDLLTGTLTDLTECRNSYDPGSYLISGDSTWSATEVSGDLIISGFSSVAPAFSRKLKINFSQSSNDGVYLDTVTLSYLNHSDQTKDSSIMYQNGDFILTVFATPKCLIVKIDPLMGVSNSNMAAKYAALAFIFDIKPPEFGNLYNLCSEAPVVCNVAQCTADYSDAYKHTNQRTQNKIYGYPPQRDCVTANQLGEVILSQYDSRCGATLNSVLQTFQSENMGLTDNWINPFPQQRPYSKLDGTPLKLASEISLISDSYSASFGYYQESIENPTFEFNLTEFTGIYMVNSISIYQHPDYSRITINNKNYVILSDFENLYLAVPEVL